MSPQFVATKNPTFLAMNATVLPVAILALAATATAQGGAFLYPATGRLTIDRAYHYRAECKVGNVDALVVDEYLVNPAAREANVPAAQTGGSASTRWGLVPTAYLPYDPIAEIEPVAMVASVGLVLLAGPAVALDGASFVAGSSTCSTSRPAMVMAVTTWAVVASVSR